MSIWHQRWNEGRIGFHRLEANATLTDYWSKLRVSSSSSVLVPLCGKSLDMHWLSQQGHSVIGVEMVQKAITEFFKDWKKQPVTVANKSSYEKIALYHADFFSVQPDEVPIASWYDRAAMVALPSSLRAAYVEQILHLTSADARGLLVTFDYPQKEMHGPPFALPDSEVETLFSPTCNLERIHFVDLTEEEDRSLSRCTLSVYLLTRHS